MPSSLDQLIANVDNIILSFVQGSFGSFSATISVFWNLMFIVFIAVFGYKVIVSGRFSAPELLVNIVKIIIILAVATEWDTFFLLVFNLATDLPSDIAGQLVTTASTTLSGSAVDTVDNANLALSLYYDRSLAVTDKILEGADWFDFGIYLYAGSVALTALIFSGYAAMLIILAKLAVAILLAVGPIFILLLMFNNTKNLFEGWLRTLINFAIIPIFIYAVIAFFLVLAESPLQYLEENSDVNAELLSAIAPFLLVSVVGIMVMAQVMNMAASITGGLSLSTLGAGAWMARTGSRLTQRAPAAAGKASVIGYNAARHPRLTATAAKNRLGQTIKNIRGF